MFCIYIHLLVFKTTQFYQLKDLLFSVDWSFIVEKNIWAMESCGGFVLCPGREKIILAKSRTGGEKWMGGKFLRLTMWLSSQQDVVDFRLDLQNIQSRKKSEKKTVKILFPSLLTKRTIFFLFLGTANISEEHLNHARKWGTPVDCTWIIRAEVSWTLINQYMIMWL